MILPPGTHNAEGRPLRRTTQQLIRTLARLPVVAHAVAGHWQRHRRFVEALALLDAAAIDRSRLRPRLLAELELYQALLGDTQRQAVPDAPLPMLGLAQLATGEPERAVPVLAAAIAARSAWGPWMRAATALAILAPERLEAALRRREHEPAAALLLAHLAERRGDATRAAGLLAASQGGAGRPAEADLLAANIDRAKGDAAGARAAEKRLFARFGLTPADEKAAVIADGPMVSIIIAAFDAATTIGAAVASLLGQSWQPLEIILVDDCSSDGTVEAALGGAAGDPRLRVLRLPENEGAYVARNAGLGLAQGEFVTLHDADDIAHPRRIELQLKPLLARAELVATTARWIRRQADGRFRDRGILPLIRLHTGSTLVRRRFLVSALEGFDAVRYGADGDLLLRLETAAGSGRVEPLNLPLTMAGANPASAVHAESTGYGVRGYSPARQLYREHSVTRCIRALLSETPTDLRSSSLSTM